MANCRPVNIEEIPASEGPIVSLNTVYLDNNIVLNREDIPFAGAGKIKVGARIEPPKTVNRKSILKSSKNTDTIVVEKDKSSVTNTNKACEQVAPLSTLRPSERPKTVAFGRTVPLSQTIEANSKPASSKPEMNSVRPGRFVIRADLDELKELINAQRADIDSLKQRIEQLEKKDARRVSEMSEMFETQARFSERLIKIENTRILTQDQAEQSYRKEPSERTLKVYRPNSPPPAPVQKLNAIDRIGSNDNLREEFERRVQTIQSDPVLMKQFLNKFDAELHLNSAESVLKDCTNPKSYETGSRKSSKNTSSSMSTRSVIQRKVIAHQVQQDFHPESPRGLRKSTIQWMEQIQHEHSPRREIRRESPKRFNERRPQSSSNKYNRGYETRPKLTEPTTYEDEEDDELVSKQQPNYFVTNDELVNSEEYDDYEDDNRAPTPPREHRNESPVYRNRRY